MYVMHEADEAPEDARKQQRPKATSPSFDKWDLRGSVMTCGYALTKRCALTRLDSFIYVEGKTDILSNYFAGS